jgi:hypothetical protein
LHDTSAKVFRFALGVEEFDSDAAERHAHGGGDVSEAAFGEVDLAIHELDMKVRFALNGVNDVGGTESDIHVVEVVAVEQAALIGFDGEPEDPDVGVLEDFVMARFFRDRDFFLILREGCGGEAADG